MGRPELGNLLSRARTAWHRTGDLILAVACFLLSLFLYLRTLAPTVVALFDDTLEFPLAVHRMAIAHPTGYPLYLLLGKLVGFVPWRDVAGRVNLLSAVAGAVAVALVFLVARQMTRRRGTALLAAGALAVSPVFWSQAVVAEVYTLNAAFVAGLLLAALCWARRPLKDTPPPSPPLRQGGGTSGDTAAAGEGEMPAEPESTLTPTLSLEGRGGSDTTPTTEAPGEREVPAEPESTLTPTLSLEGRGGAAEARLQLHPAIYGLAALVGLALTHHRTALLLVPALLLFLLLTERRVATRAALLGPERPAWPRWRRALARPAFLLLLALVLPLLLYLYLPIRGDVGSLDGTYVNTWGGFWRWVLASSYGSFLGENPLARPMDAAGFAGLFWAQLGPLGLALAVLGVAGLVRRPKVLALTGTAFLTFLLFGILYRAPDLEVFFIPAFLVLAVWAGAGLDHALDLLRIRGPSLAMRRVQAAAGLILVLGAIGQVAVTGARAFPEVDRSARWEAHDLAQYWLRPALAPDGSVVGLLGEMTLLRYFQETQGLAPGLHTIVADDPAARLAAVEAEAARGRTVYVTRSLEGLSERYSLSAVAGAIDMAGQAEALVRVGEPQRDTAGIPNPMSLEVAPGIELLGYSLEEHGAHGQGWVTLRLWWRAPQGVQQPLKVSARLVDAQGEVTAAVDAEPVAWTYPVTAWRPGEVVADAYEIRWPAGAAPGLYTPLVILYDPAPPGQEHGRVELPAQPLAGNPALPEGRSLETSIARTSRARFGTVALLGYTAPDAAAVYAPGASPALTLLWQAAETNDGDLGLEILLNGTALSEVPVGGSFPTSRWAEGQSVRQVIRLSLPADLGPGRYALKLRVSRDSRPVAWSRGIVPGGSDFCLGEIVVGRP